MDFLKVIESISSLNQLLPLKQPQRKLLKSLILSMELSFYLYCLRLFLSY